MFLELKRLGAHRALISKSVLNKMIPTIFTYVQVHMVMLGYLGTTWKYYFLI